LPLVGLVIILAPSGSMHAGSSMRAGSTAFTVRLSGKPEQIVRLRAVGIPSGYIASFCTRHLCAPFRVTFALPKSGRDSIELQVIENVAASAAPRSVSVAAAGARTVSIAYPHRTGAQTLPKRLDFPTLQHVEDILPAGPPPTTQQVERATVGSLAAARNPAGFSLRAQNSRPRGFRRRRCGRD